MISIDEIVEFCMSCPDASIFSLLVLVFVVVLIKISPIGLFAVVIAAATVFALVTERWWSIPIAIGAMWIVYRLKSYEGM